MTRVRIGKNAFALVVTGKEQCGERFVGGVGCGAGGSCERPTQRLTARTHRYCEPVAPIAFAQSNAMSPSPKAAEIPLPETSPKAIAIRDGESWM